MIDIALIESNGNGGDIQKVGHDLGGVYSLENMVYIALFVGNVEQSTGARKKGAQAFDYWGNSVDQSNPDVQFNSLTERALNTTPLTSSGRVIIENAIKKDLEFLSNYNAVVTVTVSITATDRISIDILIAIDDKNSSITQIEFKKSEDGDFFILDFNTDFF